MPRLHVDSTPLLRLAYTRHGHLRRGWTSGNELQLFFSGPDAFSAKFSALELSRTLSWWSTYELHDDRSARRACRLLSAARARGSHALLVYDGWGASATPATDAVLLPFNPLLRRLLVGSWGRLMARNHQKLVLADDIAFCGGMNLGDGYAGAGDEPLRYRDAHVRVRGPAVRRLRTAFVQALAANPSASPALLFHARQAARKQDLEEVGRGLGGVRKGLDGVDDLKQGLDGVEDLRQGLDDVADLRQDPEGAAEGAEPPAAGDGAWPHGARHGKEDPQPSRARDEGVCVRVLTQSARGRRARRLRRRAGRGLYAALAAAVRRSRASVYLTSPYFLPPVGLRAALMDAARRGVDVRVATSGTTDQRLHLLAAQQLYGSLLHEGVRIYEYDGEGVELLHAKLCVIDGVYGSVGSFNLDRWSRHNLEAAVAVMDAGVCERLTREFDDICQKAREVSAVTHRNRPLWRKVAAWGAFKLFAGVFHPAWGPRWITDHYDPEYSTHDDVDDIEDFQLYLPKNNKYDNDEDDDDDSDSEDEDDENEFSFDDDFEKFEKKK